MIKGLALVAALGLFALANTASAVDATQRFAIHNPPKPLQDIQFADGDGRLRQLSEFRGKALLLNVWATWCPPCREEMPTLDRLQAELGGQDFEVMALSIDRAGMAVVTRFYDETGVKHLSKYIDSSGKAARELAAFGLPTTLLIDREGREVGRLIGPAEWDSPQMVSFIRSRLGMGKDSSLDIPQIRQEAMVIPVDNIESPVALNHQPLEEMTR